VYPWPPRNDDEAQRFYNHIRTVAWYLDAIPYLTQAGLPFRVGVDDIIGAIPFYGDLVGVVFAAYMVLLCWIFGVPFAILQRMVINVGIDAVLGVLPVLGDILDTLFKSNLRNLALLEDWLLQGTHTYNIQITPSDEFLPKKTAFTANNGGGGLGGWFSNFVGGDANGAKKTDGRDKYRTSAAGNDDTGSATGSASVPKGTTRLNRKDLQPEDLD